MPLRPGSSGADLKANLKQLRAEGKPLNQAIAISLKKAGKSTGKKASKKNLLIVLGPRG